MTIEHIWRGNFVLAITCARADGSNILLFRREEKSKSVTCVSALLAMPPRNANANRPQRSRKTDHRAEELPGETQQGQAARWQRNFSENDFLFGREGLMRRSREYHG